jgi:hypothetical protein
MIDIWGSGTDTIPVSMMASPGEGIRIYTREEMSRLRQRDTYITGDTFSRSNINENNYNDVNIIVHTHGNETPMDLARKMKQIVRENKAGVMTEISKQQERRA